MPRPYGAPADICVRVYFSKRDYSFRFPVGREDCLFNLPGILVRRQAYYAWLDAFVDTDDMCVDNYRIQPFDFGAFP